MKARWALGDPRQKRRQPRMGAQGFDGVVAAGQFGLGQGGVNFIVADLMQKHDRPALAAAQFRRQVMQALLGVLWNRSLAQRAGWQIIHEPQEWRKRAGRQGKGSHG